MYLQVLACTLLSTSDLNFVLSQYQAVPEGTKHFPASHISEWTSTKALFSLVLLGTRPFRYGDGDSERRRQGGLQTLAATGSGGYSDGEGSGPWRQWGAAATGEARSGGEERRWWGLQTLAVRSTKVQALRTKHY